MRSWAESVEKHHKKCALVQSVTHLLVRHNNANKKPFHPKSSGQIQAVGLLR
jgi:hypothetical protein